MKTATVTFANGAMLHARIAVLQADMREGLSGVVNLLPDHGLLLDYLTPTRASVWMKGMRIPLDIIFLSQSKIVRSIAASVPATSKAIYSFDSTRYVLETNAGWCAERGIDVGAQATIRLIDSTSNPTGASDPRSG